MDLEGLIRGVAVKEKLRRLNHLARQSLAVTAAAVLCSGYAAQGHVSAQQERYAVPEARYEQPASDYGIAREFYVHVPSWVTIRKVPAHLTGPHLYGFTYPSTGEVFIRDDLYDNPEKGELRETEVRLHEVLHNLYPSASEGEIRAHVRSILGSRAVIHQRLG